MLEPLAYLLLLPLSTGVCAGYWWYRLELHLATRAEASSPTLLDLSSL